ncbi:hypothetical protein HXZ66_02975 [Bacillus sp. A116_S68]|jgi:hypothetical protein|nr:hypothetical protein HXZ66_02975 [Bacillus sp. A116_S68]
MFEMSFDIEDFYIDVGKTTSLALRIYGEKEIYVPIPQHQNDGIIYMSTGGVFETSHLKVVGDGRLIPGSVKVRWKHEEDGSTSVNSEVNLPENCKSSLYLLRGCKVESIEYVALDSKREISNEGFLRNKIRPINYPRFAKMPLWFVTTKDCTELYFLWRTVKLESKNIAAYYDTRQKGTLIGLSHHARKNYKSKFMEIPKLEFGFCDQREDVVLKRLCDLEKENIIVPFEKRDDKTTWLSDICLNIHLSGEHWTGRTINSFNDMALALDQLSNSLQPGKFTVMVMGWDGPYYRSMVNLTPSDKLGGKEAFSFLRERVRELGGKFIVFAPFCIMNRQEVTDQGWDKGILKRPWGGEAWNDWVDWDGDFENEPSGVFMNLGYAPVRKELVNRYKNLVEEFDIDGIYLDVTNYWEDDPDNDHLRGVYKFIKDLRALKHDLLVCGENWYDHLLGVFPLFGEPGNEMGIGDFLLRYCRSAAYIACPSPLGSGGIHEKGRNYFGQESLKKSNIPYLMIAEDWKECILDLINITENAMSWKPNTYSTPIIDLAELD